MRRSPTTSVLPLQMVEPAWLGLLVRSHGCSYSYCGLSCFPFVGEVFFFMCSAFCYSVMTLVFLGACSITAAVIAVIGTLPAFLWVRALSQPSGAQFGTVRVPFVRHRLLHLQVAGPTSSQHLGARWTWRPSSLHWSILCYCLTYMSFSFVGSRCSSSTALAVSLVHV